jgi:UDP-N-acetylglucosamine 2-epimerase (non-hydrolysing)
VSLLHVVGARPNFAKVAPVWRACQARGMAQALVHTGQHYDANMSQVFLDELGLPAPDENLGVGSGSHAEQTARIMMAIEPVLVKRRPRWLVVYGDVNSTIAAALVAAKLEIPVAHVEAGLRSFDRSMPEEINRLLTDQIAMLLLTPSEDGDANLLREGIARERIHCVGNVMIDTLVRLLPQAIARPRDRFPKGLALVTLHRPSNVDIPTRLEAILDTLIRLSTKLPVVFPVHPRTRARIGNRPLPSGLQLIEPLGYLDFLGLEREARVVITDSGGVQEETTFLQVPCLTLRPNTERPVTVTLGSNVIVGDDLPRLEQEVDSILGGAIKISQIPPLWDGHAGERIAQLLMRP